MREFLEAASADMREFFREDGTFRPIRQVPRALTMLVKSAKLQRFIPADTAGVLGLPAVEVTELRWESQANLMLRAIEMLVQHLAREGGRERTLSDEEVEVGALRFLLARRPDLREKYPGLAAEAEPPKEKGK